MSRGLERLTGRLLVRQLRITPETKAYFRDFQIAIDREGIQGDGVPPVRGPLEWARWQYPSDPDSVADKIFRDLSRLTKALGL